MGRGLAISIGALERKEFRRTLAFSLAAHALLAFFLIFSPGGDVVMPQGVIAVELVAAPSSAPAPAPRKPAPSVPAPPPPPVPKQVVLPKEPAPTPVAKPEPEPKPAPKPEPEPVEEPSPEREYSDVLSELRAEVGEEAETAEPAPAQTAAIGSPTGAVVSAEFLAWERRARIHVRQNWVVPPAFRNEPLRTSILVELDAAGAVIDEPRVVKSSGNPWYDEGVVRSIQKASPLPAPPEAGEWSFVFVADESL